MFVKKYEGKRPVKYKGWYSKPHSVIYGTWELKGLEPKENQFFWLHSTGPLLPEPEEDAPEDVGEDENPEEDAEEEQPEESPEAVVQNWNGSYDKDGGEVTFELENVRVHNKTISGAGSDDEGPFWLIG